MLGGGGVDGGGGGEARGALFYSRVGVVGANGRDGVESLVFFVFRAGGGGDVRRGGAGHEEHVILVGSRAGWVWWGWDGRGGAGRWRRVGKGNCLPAFLRR